MLSRVTWIGLLILLLAPGVGQTANAQVATEWHRMPDLPEQTILAKTAEFKGELYLLGCARSALEKSRLGGLKSADGTTWTAVNLLPDTPGAYGSLLHLAANQSKLWVSGYNYALPQIPPYLRSSADGATWNDVSLPSGEEAYLYRNLCTDSIGFAVNNRHFVVGYNSTEKYAFQYSSSDLDHWTSEPVTMEFMPRSQGSSIIFKNQVYLIGSYFLGNYDGSLADATFNDVWRSSDGHHWEKIADSLPWQGTRFAPTVVATDDSIYAIGGEIDIYGKVTSTAGYQSSDAIHWQRIDSPPPFGLRYLYNGCVFKNRLLLMGGTADFAMASASSKEVWWTPAVARRLQVPPGTIEFGHGVPPRGAIVRPVHLVNTSTQTVQILGTVFTGAGSNQFAFSGTPDLSPLAPQTTRTLQVAYTPQTYNQQINELVFTTNLDGETTVPVSLVADSGYFAQLSVSTDTLNFGTATVNTPTTRSLTLTNTGTTVTTITNLYFYDSSGQLIVRTEPPMGYPFTLEAGASVTILAGYRRTPTAPLNLNVNLQILSSTAENTPSVQLIGQLDAMQAEVTPSSLDFGVFAPGDPESAAKSITVRNPGNSPLTINSLSFNNAVTTRHFHLETSSTTPLAAHGERVYPITFIPGDYPGHFMETLKLRTNLGTVTVPLAGIVGDPAALGLVWSPFAHGFETTRRLGAGGLYFKGNYTVLGGWTGSQWLNDVWQSDNLLQWARATEHAAFPGRGYFSCAEFNGKIWVVGGHGTGGAKSDVWHSSDGAHWTSATLQAAFGPRASATCVAFKNKLWLIGGGNYLTSTSTAVFNSTDGIAWTAQPTPPFAARRNAVALVLGEWLYVIGGYSRCDVWRTNDGSTWTNVSPARFITPAGGSIAMGAVAGNKLWVALVGLPESDKSRRGKLVTAPSPTMQIWNSSDGVQWELVADSIAAPQIVDGIMLTDGNALVLMNGTYGQGDFYNSTVWVSGLAVNHARHWGLFE